jgi:hypothetical protein
MRVHVGSDAAAFEQAHDLVDPAVVTIMCSCT